MTLIAGLTIGRLFDKNLGYYVLTSFLAASTILPDGIGLGDNPEAGFMVAAMLSIDQPLEMWRTAVRA